MSRRRGGQTGDVRGPTSALTSFLKEQGINSRNIRNGFSRRINDDGTVAAQPVAGPSGTTGSSSPAPGTPSALSNLAEEDETEYGASEFATPSSVPGTPISEDVSMEIEASTSKSVSIKATTSKETIVTSSSSKRKVSASVSASKKKKQKKDDSDYSGEEGDLQMQVIGAPKARYADKKPGSFAMCAECNKKFTVTRYTNQHPDIAGGILCGPCDKEIGPASGQVVGGKGKSGAGEAAAVKKRARAVKNKTVLNKDKPSIMSLTKCCIEVIGKAIQDVEEFGDIGGVNKDRVCQIVCKNRDLTQETVQLFLDIENTSLTLYDCTRLEPQALRVLANHCPNLETLKLFMCGFMDDETILHYATRLTSLKHLQLYAAFLVRKEGWNQFFDIIKSQNRTLEGFMIRQTPRLDDGNLEKLVSTCPNLTHLQLAECGKLDDTSLGLLHGLKQLRYLDISKGGLKGESFTDDGVIPLLEAVGENLSTLILDDNLLLTDRTLIEGIKVNCPNLIELSLKNLGEILPTGIAELFSDDWVNQKGMVRINLHRCIQLDDQALEAVVKHSGISLLKLDLNSVDQVTDQSLKVLAENAPALMELDVSFVRMVDDFLLKHMLERLPTIKKISIYGNNRISDMCPQKAGWDHGICRNLRSDTATEQNMLPE